MDNVIEIGKKKILMGLVSSGFYLIGEVLEEKGDKMMVKNVVRAFEVGNPDVGFRFQMAVDQCFTFEHPVTINANQFIGLRMADTKDDASLISSYEDFTEQIRLGRSGIISPKSPQGKRLLTENERF